MTSLGERSLPTATAGLEKGVADGYHLGAQLEVWLDGSHVASVVVGRARDDVAMRADTLLPWFSCTKIVTAVATLQQWERGALDLDDPVDRFVPEFAGLGKERVTVRHLLTHTAGLREAISGTDAWRLEWEALVARIAAAPLDEGWVPGRRAAYHPTTAFLVLGEIVRRLDGRPFDAYVAEEIFEPLDMPDSWLALTDVRYSSYGDRMGVMYDTTRKAAPVPVRSMDSARGYRRVQPAGSGVGPMRDLVRLMEALRGGGELEGQRVLAPQTVEAMAARHRAGMRDETFGMVIDWGLGVMVNSFAYRGRPTSYGYGKRAGRRAFGHGGSQSSLAFVDPDAGLAVALCCNGMPGEAGNHRRTQPVITALYDDLGLNARTG
ncbi:MAG TPA: serine hydrolase domain-containing protein [Acidimicrobiales bacterium]|nr:serine hydrolase domain-containing protein [Acidimicrobiales bacterium]